MIQKVKEYIRQYRIIEPKDKVIVGLSGGADSVCLFLLLLELQEELDFKLQVLHVEHGIRGQESIEDANFVTELCQKHNIKCKVVTVDVPSYSRQKGLGHEEAARILRYEAFSKLAIEEEAKVALAHHMEDNAETIIFQMLRGSGLKGLSGIAPVRRAPDGVTYIRPLLGVNRQEIEDYLGQRGQGFRTDSTNFDVDYDRNKLRHKVFPELLSINSQAVSHINQSASQLYQVWDYMDSQAGKAYDRIVKEEDDRIILDIAALKECHPAIQSMVVLDAISRAAGRRKDISQVHVASLLELASLQSGRQVSLPYQLMACREYGSIIVSRAAENIDKNFSLDKVQETRVEITAEMLKALKLKGEAGQVPLPDGQWKIVFTFRSFDGKMNQIPKKPYTKWVDYDKIKLGFCVRKRMTGDYFINDSKGHRKKLKEYFINEKIPVSRRDEIWLIAKDSEVIDIQGDRLSQAYKVLESTREVLEIRYERLTEANHGF